MSNAPPTGSPRLRVVRPDEVPLPRRRPGPAVLAVVLYTALFAIALWYLRAKAPRGDAPAAVVPDGRAPSSEPRPRGSGDRTFLLSGAGLVGAAREKLETRLKSDRCDCGCGLTLHDCLARDQSCSRSPELAGDLAKELR